MPAPTAAAALRRPYRHGFVSDIAADTLPVGLDEGVVRTISAKKNEPAWLLEKRLAAYHYWCTLKEPTWQNLTIAPIEYQNMSYYSAPKNMPREGAAGDPEILKTFARLGIPLSEQKKWSGVALDAVLDSVSVATVYGEKLHKLGIIFCPFQEAVQKHAALVRQYLGTVVPYTDNFFAALNSAVCTDGSFVYIPPGVTCPVDLSTYFRINAAHTGQFERTLIVADEGSTVSYLEGCTAPQRSEHQLHAAVVELIALPGATIRYATVQNWYPGDSAGVGGVYNFVTKRGMAHARSHISWTQVETGSAITWKYPSVILKGDDATGEFYSLALTRAHQQADTGTKMIHLGKRTRSRIVSKSIAAGESRSTYRGLVCMHPTAVQGRNISTCDTLLMGDAVAFTYPTLVGGRADTHIEHEATTSRVHAEQLRYLASRGLPVDAATSLIVHGFSREILGKLPMEFALEARNLLALSMEGALG